MADILTRAGLDAVMRFHPRPVRPESAAMKHFVLATAAAFIVTMATGVTAVARNEWFGSGDLQPYAIYSTAFAMLTAPVSVAAYRWTKLNVWFSAVFAFIFGLLFGTFGTYAVALFLGPWMGAMSVPILPAWCLAAAFTFSAAVLVGRLRSSSALLAALAGLAFVSIGGVLVFQPAVSLALNDQHLIVYFYRYIPGDTELDLSEVVQDLDAADIEILRQTGLKGKLKNYGFAGGNTTEWPRAKALLVFTAPSASNSVLPQPKRCTIAYVQDGAGYRRVPEVAKTLEERSMRIEPGPSGSYLVLEDVRGGKQSFLIF